MAYSNFTTLEQIVKELGIIPRYKKIFGEIKKIEPSNWLKTTLSYSYLVSSENEKTKSETIVQPILLELIKRNEDFIKFYSGSTLNADKEKGLTGECDFMITKNIENIILKNSILQVVEAKDHDMSLGIPQCISQMLGTKIFNEKNNANIDCIYGCVTTGDVWLFLKLCDNELFVDKQKYYLSEVDKILGVFQTIIDYYKN